MYFVLQGSVCLRRTRHGLTPVRFVSRHDDVEVTATPRHVLPRRELARMTVVYTRARRRHPRGGLQRAPRPQTRKIFVLRERVQDAERTPEVIELRARAHRFIYRDGSVHSKRVYKTPRRAR